MIIITDLPICVQTKKYVEHLKARELPFISAIEDRSASDAVRIEIKLVSGGFAAIESGYGDAEIDPIEDALMLRVSLRPQLNYYSIDDAVVENTTYMQSIAYWAPIRRDLYKTRLERQQTVLSLKILELTEILRYIAEARELDLASIESVAAAIELLRQRNYVPIYTSLLHAPEYTPNSELRGLVLGSSASYSYILNLRAGDLIKSAVATKQKQLEKIKTEYDTVTSQLAESPFAGASVWLSELPTL